MEFWGTNLHFKNCNNKLFILINCVSWCLGPNTSVGFRGEGGKVGGSVSSLPIVQVNITTERTVHSARGPQAQECPALNLPGKPGDPVAQGPTASEQLCT